MKPKIVEIHLKGAMTPGICKTFLGTDTYRVTETSGIRRVQADGGFKRLVFHHEAGVVPGLARQIGAMRAHVKSRLSKGLIKECYALDEYVKASAVNIPEGSWTECFELDLTAAWFTSARELGAVDRKFYGRVMRTSSKIDRLRMVGALATSRSIEEWKDGKPAGNRRVEYSCPETVPVLRWIRAHTDNMMRKLMRAARGDFLMYFADAVFIKKDKKTARRLRELAEQHGFRLKDKRKVYLIGYAENPNAPHAAKIPTVKRAGEDPRPFCI